MKHWLPAICMLFLLFSGKATSYAQGENNNWMFGHNTRLNFSTIPPTLYVSNMQCWEGGSVAFSDASGSLMFYSNGNQIWNASGNVMPNGNGLLGNGPTAAPPYGYPCSSSQGTIVIQSVSNPQQFYLFVLDAMEDGPPYAVGHLRYSLIDMSLDGGQGDVVTGKKNMVLADSMTEKMTVIRADGCGFWLLTHKMYSNKYHAFKIDAAGLHEPVISNGEVGGELGYGMLHASPDGKMIVMTGAGPLVELSRFDNISGVVSEAGHFGSPGGKIGACISPDNTKLYIGHYNKLSQYDLSFFPNVPAIDASEEIISSNITYGQMRRGPDNKIYIANVSSDNIAIITDPDALGPACGYELFGMSRPTYAQFPPIPPLPSAVQYGSGLGQEVWPATNMLNTIIRSVKDTMICGGKPIILQVEPGYDGYTWSNGVNTNKIIVDGPGVYWAKSFINCDVYIDSFHVASVGPGDWKLANDTAICPGDTLFIDASQPGITGCTWQDGSHQPVFPAPGAGIYIATVDIKGCALTDTIEVSDLHIFTRILEPDTTICRGTSILLHAVAYPESVFRWEDNSINPNLLTSVAGLHTVEATNVCGTFSDAIRIEQVSCDCIAFAPTAFSPNGDGINDRYAVSMDCSKLIMFDLRIFNRYGQQVYQSADSKQGWDGSFKARPSDAGTYFYFLEFKASDRDIEQRKGSIDLIR